MAKYVIVGGVAAGMSGAARLRRMDEEGEIVVFERGAYVSYANCGLPYYIGDVITDRRQLLVQTAAGFGRRFKVDVRTQSEVIRVDADGKKVRVRNAAGEEYEESYDKLLLAPGGSPVRPAVPGIDHPAIHTLWTVPETDSIREMVDGGEVRTALVVGAGFIGLEMAENLHARGIRVVVVEALKQPLNLLDFEMAALVRRELVKQGIDLRLGESVTGFETAATGGVTAHLSSGDSVAADLVLLSVGVRPNTGFLAGSGITLGERGHILVDEFLRTSDPAVFAAGDAVEVLSPLTGKKTAVPLAGPANKQGRIVADTMVLGPVKKYRGTYGTSIAKVFGLSAGMTGLTEKACASAGISCGSVIIHPLDHAGYYPGAAMMALKLVYSPESRRVLGAQAVGTAGVDKRIDIIATAILGGMTVDDLTEVEHAYAPPYSSAKDPVNMAGFVAQNILDGLSSSIAWDAISAIDPARDFLLDVRTPFEFAGGTIPGAVNIPLDELRERLGEIPAGKRIVAFCRVGLRGYLAVRLLAGYGFSDCVNLSGGVETYLAAMA